MCLNLENEVTEEVPKPAVPLTSSRGSNRESIPTCSQPDTKTVLEHFNNIM